MRFGKSEWNNWERGIEREWLLTNGIGGFSSSTITGGNSRRYHGLLVAALQPPVRRHLILSQLHETITTTAGTFNLHSYSTNDSVMKGYHHLQSFELDPLPVYTYAVGSIFIEKTVTMVYGENTVAVVYRIRNGAEDGTVKITPLVNFRDYHSNSNKSTMRFRQISGKNSTRIVPYDTTTEIHIYCRDSRYIPLEDCWFEHMHYAVEQERGLHAFEDHYIPGSFEVFIKAQSDITFTFICSIEKDKELEDVDGCSWIDAEKARLAALTKEAGCRDEFSEALVRAADQFIVYRHSTGAKTILAGYPWFTDWGRDAMISLSGLTLSTGRYDDAAQILSTFSEYIQHGLVPNMFPDAGGDPGYNTVDAALWYMEAIGKYVEYTGDIKLVKEKLLSSMVQIYKGYKNGTLHNIHMDEDGLIIAGDENTQLTWMDAKMGSMVFTPRHGKAVEINALWYNALKILESIFEGFASEDTGQVRSLATSLKGAAFSTLPEDSTANTGSALSAEEFRNLADKVKESFEKVFWNEEGKYLYDVVNGDVRDSHVRPNQIFAVSLSHPVIKGEKARSIVDTVWKELYTAYGLRSLSQQSRDYKGQCTGDQYSRDSAYHQGTVWAWPIGHFIDAFADTLGKEPEYSGHIALFLKPFQDHLKHACMGSISEIFDGDEPLTPRGCFAQAWSVAEVLRVYKKVK